MGRELQQAYDELAGAHSHAHSTDGCGLRLNEGDHQALLDQFGRGAADILLNIRWCQGLDFQM